MRLEVLLTPITHLNQARVQKCLGGLQVPCLCIRFEQWVTSPQDARVSDLQLSDRISGLQDLLAASLPNLRFLAIITGPYAFKNVNIPFKAERTWWRITRRDGDGGSAVAELIPRWRGERLRDHLHGMDYKSLSKLRASEIELP